jgi:hypothetical protein
MTRAALVIPDTWRTAASPRRHRACSDPGGTCMSAQDHVAHFRAALRKNTDPPCAPSHAGGGDWRRANTSADSGLRTGGPALVPPPAESDTTLYWLMLAVGVVPVAVVLIRHGTWGVAPTVGAMFCVLSLRALLVAHIVRWRDRTKPTGRPSQRAGSGSMRS